MNVSGGLVTGLEAESGSVVNITGGTVDTGIFFAASVAGLVAESGSEVNISGTQFLLNGELLDALVVGESFTITEPIETLTGMLADGSPFSFGEGGRVVDEGSGIRNFSPGATITVTLEAPLLLGDVSGDGVVNFLDISPFITVLSAGGFQDEADIDRNGVVNFLDITPFIGILIE